MSLCINPHCPQPNHPGNQVQQICQGCGSKLILQERYRVMRLLSDDSGFGYVYEAFESNVPKILKVLKEIHNDNIKAIELFEQEARVLGQLNHPGIPAIEEPGCFQFRPNPSGPLLHCIVMEKIDGPNLREWMRQQSNHPVNVELALNWLTQLVSILHLVHQHSYFHRDIKPENIMLRASGDLVLVDFGAAREMTCTYFDRLERAEGVTRVSSTGYTPPEQERGRAVPQSDFYALGCTFIFLLTGQRPLEPQIYDALQNQFHWRQYAPTVPAAFADLIDQMTAARAVDRPANTGALLQRLSQLRASLPAALPTTSEAPPPTPPTGTEATTPPSPPPLTVIQANTLLQGTEDKGSPAQRPSLPRPVIWLMALGLLTTTGLAVRQWQWPPATNQAEAEAPPPYSAYATFKGHSAQLNTLALSLDGTMLASGSDDQTIKLWDVQAGKELRTLPRHSDRVQAVAFSPDGKLVISGSGSSDLLVWETATGVLRTSLTGHDSAINDIKVSSDGRILASASADRTIRLWDLQRSELLQVLEGHQSYVNAVVFTPDGTTLLSGSADRTIRSWPLEGGEASVFAEHNTFINAIAVSPDGATLISAGADDSIVLWNLETREISGRLEGHEGFVNDIEVSPSGRLLISSSADSTLKVWNLAERQLLFSIPWKGILIDPFAVRFGNPHWQVLAGGQGSTDIQGWRIER
ncbi:MAG: serine/threonine-protein kinase [Cyanobacteria bacterium P01_A01_bin.135]